MLTVITKTEIKETRVSKKSATNLNHLIEEVKIMIKTICMREHQEEVEALEVGEEAEVLEVEGSVVVVNLEGEVSEVEDSEEEAVVEAEVEEEDGVAEDQIQILICQVHNVKQNHFGLK